MLVIIQVNCDALILCTQVSSISYNDIENQQLGIKYVDIIE